MRREKPLRAICEVGALVSTASLFLSCSSHALVEARARVELKGPAGAEVEILKVGGQGVRATDPRQLLPQGSLQAGRSYSFPPGSYYALNDCSAYFFELKSDEVLELHLQRVTLTPDLNASIRFPQTLRAASADGPLTESPQLLQALWPDLAAPRTVSNMQGPLAGPPAGADPVVRRDVTPSTCRHPLTGDRKRFESRTEFELLPGQVSLSVGGRRVVPDQLRNEPVSHHVPLYPVLVKEMDGQLPSTYFVMPKGEFLGAEPPVVAATMGEILWLPAGKYELELNGTRLPIGLDKEGVALALGAIEIESPQAFPIEERMKLGGAPPFAFINSGVLFTLGTVYPVFPGRYELNLDGSDMRKEIFVDPAELTRLRTAGAVVEMPSCEAEETCGKPVQITVHSGQRPFAIMTLDAGMPFLVLDEDFEYGVEGLRGVLRRLKTSKQDVAREQLARLKLEWQLKQAAPRVRTDLVRLETDDPSLFGKSLDLLFSQPRELYVPPGRYLLTYFVGDPNGERKKVSRPLRLGAGQTVDIDIPIYAEKLASSARGKLAPRGAPEVRSKVPSRLPKRLKPLKGNSNSTQP